MKSKSLGRVRIGYRYFPGADCVNYSFPLRPDFTALLILPRELTLADVRRIERFLSVIAWDKEEDAPALDDMTVFNLVAEQPVAPADPGAGGGGNA